jgi:hypothetical protein
MRSRNSSITTLSLRQCTRSWCSRKARLVRETRKEKNTKQTTEEARDVWRVESTDDVPAATACLFCVACTPRHVATCAAPPCADTRAHQRLRASGTAKQDRGTRIHLSHSAHLSSCVSVSVLLLPMISSAVCCVASCREPFCSCVPASCPACRCGVHAPCSETMARRAIQGLLRGSWTMLHWNVLPAILTLPAPQARSRFLWRAELVLLEKELAGTRRLL